MRKYCHRNTYGIQKKCCQAHETSHCSSTNLSEAGEHAAHGLVVETLRAVDDYDVVAQTFAQILGGFGLAGTGRSLGRAAAVKVKRRGQRYVAPDSSQSHVNANLSHACAKEFSGS